MRTYEVGKPYIDGRTNWPEVVEYNYRRGQHELRMFLGNPSQQEIAAIRRGPARFGLVVDLPVIFFVYRFEDGIAWSDAPYSIHMLPPDQRQLPPVLSEGERPLLTIMLIEARSGIIQGLRVVSLHDIFARRLHEAIQKQADQSFDQASYDAKLATVYRNFSSKQLYSRATARMEIGRQAPQEEN